MLLKPHLLPSADRRQKWRSIKLELLWMVEMISRPVLEE